MPRSTCPCPTHAASAFVLAKDVRHEAGRVEVAVGLQAGGDSAHAPGGCVTRYVPKASGSVEIVGLLAQCQQFLADVFTFQIDAEAARAPFRLAMKPFRDLYPAAVCPGSHCPACLPVAHPVSPVRRRSRRLQGRMQLEPNPSHPPTSMSGRARAVSRTGPDTVDLETRLPMNGGQGVRHEVRDGARQSPACTSPAIFPSCSRRDQSSRSGSRRFRAAVSVQRCSWHR